MIRGGYVTIPVRVVAEAVRFYVETLGLKLVSEPDGDAVLDAGEGFLVRLSARPKPTVDAAETVAFRTKVPLAEAVAIYGNRGVAFEDVSDRHARFRDPDGNPLALVA